jgi:hypothetical protein
MTMTTTNVEILRQGWLDAASALAPGLQSLPEFLEHGLEAAVIDERLDEQSLLRVVTEVTSAAADALPAEELYFLTRRLQRAVYEYLLSLDALPEPPPRRDGNGHGPADTTLIGAEEVAALGRNGHVKTVAEPVRPVVMAEASPELEAEAEVQAAATLSSPLEDAFADILDRGVRETEPDPKADHQVVAEHTAVAEPVLADAQNVEEVAPEPTPAPEPSARPAFTLFRRTGAAASKSTEPTPGSDGTAPVEPVPATGNGHAPAAPNGTVEVKPGVPAASNGTPAAKPAAPAPNGRTAPTVDTPAEDAESFVAPKSGFHLSDLADFAVVERAAPEPAATAAPTEMAKPAEPVKDAPEPDVRPKAAAETAAVLAPVPHATPDAPGGAAARGWRLRDDDTDQGTDAGSETSAEDDRFETDPEVVEARLEINDRLRRRRCDEAAALLQRLSNDVGGRALAELALDAGDRCRALGKGNAALSCYLAASRADPVHETPLLRLADICIDDHDIDLAVSYLERVTRLRRLRNDDKGALKLYRKIVTIAPYRDDILAMLMRAQANGRFDE